MRHRKRKAIRHVVSFAIPHTDRKVDMAVWVKRDAPANAAGKHIQAPVKK